MGSYVRKSRLLKLGAGLGAELGAGLGADCLAEEAFGLEGLFFGRV